jgi:hypothetical protein
MTLRILTKVGAVAAIALGTVAMTALPANAAISSGSCGSSTTFKLHRINTASGTAEYYCYAGTGTGNAGYIINGFLAGSHSGSLSTSAGTYNFVKGGGLDFASQRTAYSFHLNT